MIRGVKGEGPDGTLLTLQTEKNLKMCCYAFQVFTFKDRSDIRADVVPIGS